MVKLGSLVIDNLDRLDLKALLSGVATVRVDRCVLSRLSGAYGTKSSSVDSRLHWYYEGSVLLGKLSSPSIEFVCF